MKQVLYNRLLETTTLLYIVLDSERRVITWNLEFIARKDEVIGLPLSEVLSLWKTTEASIFVQAKYDERMFVFFENAYSECDETLYIGVETNELNSILRENEELKSLTGELDAIIENSYDAIYITDKDGFTLKTNSAIERITGIPQEYYLGKNVQALMKRGILQNSVTHKVLEHKRTISLVQKNYTGNETLLTGSPVYNDEGEIIKVVTNIRDLSDLYELQSELVKVNKLNDQYKKELNRLKNKADVTKGIITKSEAMKRIYDTAKRIANIDATILILGETGVGKDVLANYIHDNSYRVKQGEIIKVNCGAIPGELLESELFGYEEGAFTGASRKGKEGMFELADKGTIFLDEIGELPLHLQVKLLRVIQEGEIQRIGGTKPKKIDIRIITATNRNLKQMVQLGEFREDLYYRLNVIPLQIPPIRERKDDILPLIHLFLGEMNEKYNLQKELDYSLKDFFLTYNWPGNIRELSNLIERLVVTTREEIITVDKLPSEYLTSNDYGSSSLISLKEAVELAEKKVITLAAERYSSTYDMAEALGSSQSTIVRKLKKYNINLNNRS